MTVRAVIEQEGEKVCENVEVLIAPTAPTTAFKVGDKIEDPLAMYLMDVCTIPINLAGVPALSLPCGFAGGLPIGMQIIGPHLSEEKILQVAYTFEQAHDYHKQMASIREVD